MYAVVVFDELQDCESCNGGAAVILSAHGPFTGLMSKEAAQAFAYNKGYGAHVVELEEP